MASQPAPGTDLTAVLREARACHEAKARARKVWIDLCEPTIMARATVEAAAFGAAAVALIDAFLDLAPPDGIVRIDPEGKPRGAAITMSVAPAPRDLPDKLCQALSRFWQLGAATELTLEAGGEARCLVTFRNL
jgi:hypothetical protein